MSGPGKNPLVETHKLAEKIRREKGVERDLVWRLADKEARKSGNPLPPHPYLEPMLYFDDMSKEEFETYKALDELSKVD